MLSNQVSRDRGIIVAWKEAKDGWKGTLEQHINTLKLAVKWFWYKIGVEITDTMLVKRDEWSDIRKHLKEKRDLLCHFLFVFTFLLPLSFWSYNVNSHLFFPL